MFSSCAIGACVAVSVGMLGCNALVATDGRVDGAVAGDPVDVGTGTVDTGTTTVGTGRADTNAPMVDARIAPPEVGPITCAEDLPSEDLSINATPGVNPGAPTEF